jgi:hypothetical protein
MSEGRQAKEDFDVASYKSGYADLRAAFGNNTAAYYMHYISNGQAEGRKAIGELYNGTDYSAVYDSQYYYDNNGDVAAAFGNNRLALIEHFVNYGMNEGRQAKADFNVSAYKACNPDVRAAFGDDTAAYYRHYIQYGVNEGRVTLSDTVYNGVDYSAVYDKDYYYNNQKDVAAAFGNDSAALFAHFVSYGMKEGRQAKADFDVISYKNAYEDLRNAFGDDLPSYYVHYINYGQYEGR